MENAGNVNSANNKGDVHKMDKVVENRGLFDDIMVQPGVDDELENMKDTRGEDEMGRSRKEVIEETEEDLRIKEMAFKRMGNIENQDNKRLSDDALREQLDEQNRRIREMSNPPNKEEDKNEVEGKKELSDSELKEQLKKLNMNEFPSLSNQSKVNEENKQENQPQQEQKRRGRPKKEDKVEGEKNIGTKDHWQLQNCMAVFRNGSPYKWITTLNAFQLSEMYSSPNNLITYDPSIQRGVRVSAKGEEKPLIFNPNVKTILTKMLDGTMDAGQVLLNYAKEYPQGLNYDEEGTLSGQNPLSICDSAHRLEAMKIWVKKFKKNKESTKDPREFYLPVMIFNLNHQEAENLFVEANSKGRPISKTRIAFHDVFNPNRKIVDTIESNSLLKGRIEQISGSIKKSSNKIITYKTLLDNTTQFKASTPKEAEEIGLYLAEFWNELITELFPYALGNIDAESKAEQKKQSFILENMFISGYFAVANKLRGVEDWKGKLTELAENDFLSRNNPIWSFCLREGDKIVNSSKVQKQIAEIMCAKVLEEK
jgi:hypothetical protein